ncbi:rab proteins geranylgeranyltransferase component A-like isoform X1 [Macrobrachium nipponense]|uniref:rab proteins geranylgeranyltransferase component A-like isoform X1 n=1 Tax=Macrobrachium nipponense TaxID=159736 RepID=UPI0030C7D65F
MEVELPTDYDVIVVGTGLVECIVAAASARIGKKVLHIDRNDYYGGQWASFTLQGMEQWVADITTTKEETESIGTEKCIFGDGERVLPTCDPGRTYSNVKQKWYIEKVIKPEVATKETLPEVPCGEGEEEAVKPEHEKSEEIKVEDLNEEKVEESQVNSEAADQEGMVAETTTEELCSEKQGTLTPPVEVKEKQPWSQESMMKVSRKFNLDLAPKLLFSRGSLVELLISSNVARYAEFKCITRVLTWISCEDKGELVVVPCSRSDVFTTESLSLIEKRLLMKLLEFCHSYDKNPEQVVEFADKTFTEFLKSRRQTSNLIHFVTESIAMVDGNVPCSEGLEKTKLFLTSLGRYGTTPFLFSMYGCGELPQAFCRLCAVFEGTYVLRRPVSSIILSENNSCVGLFSEGERFKCSHLVMDAFYAPNQYISSSPDSRQKSISRGIFIVDRSILSNEKEQLTLLRFPAKENNGKPVTVIEVGFGAGVCPKDLFCVHMTCEGCDAEDDLKVVAQSLFAKDEESSSKPKLLWSLYFNQMDISNVDLKQDTPENIYFCSGPDALLDYDSAISQARTLFTRMFPEEEFLPRAPDPDEIVFDNAGAEPKQGDNFSSEESTSDKKIEAEVENKTDEEILEAVPVDSSKKEEGANPENSGIQDAGSDSL